MRNMSFMLTTPQVIARTKFITRRLAWWKLEPGDLLQGVKKGMGLKAGEKIVRLAVICIVDVRAEPLMAMTSDLVYGVNECKLEGFGDDPLLRDPVEFVQFFCRSHKGCLPSTVVNRIAFEYVD